MLRRDYTSGFDSAEGERKSLAFEELITAGFVEADIFASNSFVTVPARVLNTMH